MNILGWCWSVSGIVAEFPILNVTAQPATVIRYFGVHSCLGGNDVPQPSRRIPGRRISRSAGRATEFVRA
jgi:hypothetical protein